jgi:UDPglucose 6-dehydrogenase
MEMLKAIDRINERQKHVLAARIRERFGADLKGRCFAVWGLAFKPRTDDVREAPALVLIEELLAARAVVRVYDPEAMATARRQLGERVAYCAGNYEACQGADALVVTTEWNEFRRPDFERLRALLKQPVIFDGRNLYDPQHLGELGFVHVSIGRNRGR